jgi:chromosome segregation ATPase
MSNVGKLLVFLQLALSVIFAAMAGAVYTQHTQWKATAEKYKKDAEQKQSDLAAANSNAEMEKANLTQQLNDAKDAKLKVEAELQTAQVQVSALQKDKNDAASQLSTQTALAETKASEANYRFEESTKQRIINSDVQKRLDESQQENRLKTDELFATKTELTDLQERYTAMLKEKSDLEKILASKNLTYDPRQVSKLQSPPPVVDGIVREVKNDRTGRAKMLVISIGSDDGLIVGHELDAFRSGVDGRKAQWLGKVRVVSTKPDEAVVEVVETAKNGIIEKGDNVTTKLL